MFLKSDKWVKFYDVKVFNDFVIRAILQPTLQNNLQFIQWNLIFSIQRVEIPLRRRFYRL